MRMSCKNSPSGAPLEISARELQVAAAPLKTPLIGPQVSFK
jgi:hypothetical protein